MKTIEVNNPYNGELIKSLPLMNEAKVEELVARAYQLSLRRSEWMKPYQRIAILEKLVSLMKANRLTLAKQAAQEGGKPLMDSKVEVDRAIEGVKVAITNIAHLTGREIPMNLTVGSESRIAYTFREPVGVVLAISAFNHPVNLTIHQVIPAITSGCPVLIKPAKKTPLSCITVLELLDQAGLPEGWCQLLLCDNETTEKLVRDERISFMSFIGSAKVGWHLRSVLAPGTTCALEHGGVAPLIMEKDANVERLLPLLVKGAFYHAGQVCVSVQRLFLHESIATRVIDQLLPLVSQLKVGDPLRDETEVGPLITKDNLSRIAEWVQEATSKGGDLLIGGEPINETCFAPTILLNPSPNAQVSTQELFGPVLCIYTYSDRGEAIAQANSLPFSFQAAVFSQSIDTILDVVKKLNATAVMVNDHTAFRVDWMPFGGRKHSGLSMGGIINSMHDMTYEKLMVVNSPIL